MRDAGKGLLALAAVAGLLATAGPALADLGPKPTMAFTITPDKAGLTVAKGVLLQCDKATCADAHPLEQLGPQGFDCAGLACNARAYGFADYSELQISFSDGRTLKSNVFKQASFNARYTVRITAGGLLVKPR